MSYWHEKGKRDISFSDDGKEMHVYLYSDDNGAVYVSVLVSDVRDRLNELNPPLI